ncbi:hypothetical protein DFP72DRAFT_853071 [Ephemerocybe angulata]|uniref:Uncharacterized protein n=1 Tax=Ephemerocybe angulata TaxID=980116 RepID=A0A8H6M284_9AGAR|nr:hypothetical protein DFP72DRAFT_853071 [Tulosesus angulatus]
MDLLPTMKLCGYSKFSAHLGFRAVIMVRQSRGQPWIQAITSPEDQDELVSSQATMQVLPAEPQWLWEADSRNTHLCQGLQMELDTGTRRYHILKWTFQGQDLAIRSRIIKRPAIIPIKMASPRPLGLKGAQSAANPEYTFASTEAPSLRFQLAAYRVIASFAAHFDEKKWTPTELMAAFTVASFIGMITGGVVCKNAVLG